jgi:xanthine dehydrogenase FAD-binding subunit
MSTGDTAQFLAPTTLPEALAALSAAEPPAILAGGTDLWPQWNAGAPRPQRVLSLHRLAELRTVTLRDDTLRVGALCSHAALVRSPEVRQACPALAEAAATIGAQQIQNQGTVGGNVVNASPAADLPPPLVAAEAEVELASARRVRRLSLHSFYRGYREIDRQPDELLVAVLVPALPAGAFERFRKVGTRRAQAISKVVGSCRLQLDDAQRVVRAGIAFGSVGPTVLRLGELEMWLVGQPADEATARAAEARARDAVQPIDDLRSSADYRRHVVGRLVRSWIEGAAP